MGVVSRFFMYVCAVSLSLLDLTKMVTIKKLHSRLHTPVSGFCSDYVHLLYSVYGIFRGKNIIVLTPLSTITANV